jgi:hypothetical protein
MSLGLGVNVIRLIFLYQEKARVFFQASITFEGKVLFEIGLLSHTWQKMVDCEETL